MNNKKKNANADKSRWGSLGPRINNTSRWGLKRRGHEHLEDLGLQRPALVEPKGLRQGRPLPCRLTQTEPEGGTRVEPLVVLRYGQRTLRRSSCD